MRTVCERFKGRWKIDERMVTLEKVCQILDRFQNPIPTGSLLIWKGEIASLNDLVTHSDLPLPALRSYLTEQFQNSTPVQYVAYRGITAESHYFDFLNQHRKASLSFEVPLD
jgi:hypothetical protein